MVLGRTCSSTGGDSCLLRARKGWSLAWIITSSNALTLSGSSWTSTTAAAGTAWFDFEVSDAMPLCNCLAECDATAISSSLEVAASSLSNGNIDKLSKLYHLDFIRVSRFYLLMIVAREFKPCDELSFIEIVVG